MDSTTALTALNHALTVNVPVILWGPPGIGKTDRITQLANELGWPLITVLASIRQPDDFAGLPWIHNGGVTMVPPDWGRTLSKIEGPAILFFDEISSTSNATQAALLRVVLERVVGDLKLPKGVRVVAAANPPEQAAGGWDLARPLANRFTHIEWPAPNAQEWVVWLSHQRDIHPAARGLIAAFITRRPELLLQLPDSEVKGGRAWASPRSWAMAASLMGDRSSSPAVEMALMSGCVGDAVCLELVTWLESAGQLPNPEDLLADPSSWDPPEDRLDLLFATLHGVSLAAISRMEPARWKAVWEVLERAADVAADAVLASGFLLSKERARLEVTGEIAVGDYPAPLWLGTAASTIRELNEALR